MTLMTDAFQAADLIWRGVIAWDKGNGSRAPHKGYFRHQCEYIVWGTRGPCHAARHAGPFPGCIFAPVLPNDKYHQTGKPTKLLRELVTVAPPDALILDPFAGRNEYPPLFRDVECICIQRFGLNSLAEQEHPHLILRVFDRVVGEPERVPNGFGIVRIDAYAQFHGVFSYLALFF